MRRRQCCRLLHLELLPYPRPPSGMWVDCGDADLRFSAGNRSIRRARRIVSLSPRNKSWTSASAFRDLGESTPRRLVSVPSNGSRRSSRRTIVTPGSLLPAYAVLPFILMLLLI